MCVCVTLSSSCLYLTRRVLASSSIHVIKHARTRNAYHHPTIRPTSNIPPANGRRVKARSTRGRSSSPVSGYQSRRLYHHTYQSPTNTASLLCHWPIRGCATIHTIPSTSVVRSYTTARSVYQRWYDCSVPGLCHWWLARVRFSELRAQRTSEVFHSTRSP